MMSHRLLQQVLLTVTMMLHSSFPQVLMMVVQVMAMRMSQPQEELRLIHGHHKCYHLVVTMNLRL